VSLYDSNTEFNDYIDDAHARVSIFDEDFLPSRVLFELAPEPYRLYLAEFRQGYGVDIELPPEMEIEPPEQQEIVLPPEMAIELPEEHQIELPSELRIELPEEHEIELPGERGIDPRVM
jgi:hypothetical protein